MLLFKKSDDDSHLSVGGGGPSGKADEDRNSMRWMGFGIEFIGVLGIFAYGGYWGDKKYDTAPWLMVLGIVVGFVGMMYLLYKETAQWRK